jgi:hypothetical protein
MAQSTTLILLPQTVYNGGGTANIYTVTGSQQPAAAYYLGNKDLQTISYSLTNATCTLQIEATLASNPTTNDWFTVFELTANNDSNTNNTVTSFANLDGNFVYVRAIVKDFANGAVNFVKVTY